jgi:hypothetical protein
MHVNSPGRLTTQENSTSTAAIPTAKTSSETIVKTTQHVSFSATQKSHASATVTSHSVQNPALVKDLQGESIFSKNAFSPEFTDAYCAARIAIDSDQNRYYENHLGWLSPSAEVAVKKLAAVVANKSGTTQSSAAARTAFNLTPLTVNEHTEWNALAERLPPVYKSYLPTCSPWRTVEKNEVIAALSRDAAMADMLTQPDGATFVDELVTALNQKTAQMKATDHGMAITFRFPECYGTTAHISLAGVWRDETGGLKISLCHQESVPIDKEESLYKGVVYDRFDTSADYPGNVSPVTESMRLAGPPSANVFPCPHPEAIVKATQDIAGQENARQYAPTYTWLPNRGVANEGPPPETCFNVTHKVLAAMYFATAHDEQLLPDILIKMAPFASYTHQQFETLTLPNKRQVNLKEIPTLAFSEQAFLFLSIGPKWGLTMSWDVPTHTQTQTYNVVMKPGQTGIELPARSRGIKFSKSPTGLVLDGQQVKHRKTYSPSEAARMVYTGTGKDGKFAAVTSVPLTAAGTSYAKL